MFTDLDFDIPHTARAALERDPALPTWADDITVPLENVTAALAKMEVNKARQRRFKNIFGMVALIDDEVGRVLELLERRGVADDTIVVFTSGLCFFEIVESCI